MLGAMGPALSVQNLEKTYKNGTHALKGEFAGINDFEVVAFLAVLPEGD